MSHRLSRAAAVSLTLVLAAGCSGDLQESTTPNQVDQRGPDATSTPMPLEGTPTPFILESEGTGG